MLHKLNAVAKRMWLHSMQMWLSRSAKSVHLDKITLWAGKRKGAGKFSCLPSGSSAAVSG